MTAKKVFILEDEESIARDLPILLRNRGYEVAPVKRTIQEAIDYFNTNDPVDIALLDIKVDGEGNGIELARRIREDWDLPIIFTTAHSGKEYLDEALKVVPEAYLVKPFSMTSLDVAIQLAIQKHHDEKAAKNKGEEKATFQIRDKGYLVMLGVDEIIMAQADGLYTKVITQSKNYITRDILKEVEKRLPDTLFVRVHKSFLVNISYIESFNSKEIIINGTNIPIRRGFYKVLKEKLT
ncbi:DNA-binding response regulator [Echinicola marina]|uniref:LytR/AlgR family response regulator transcription factor n=1 Tax=Echinicola marina TaxID=2859768 RepID=UPI001CF64563|nr:LytTR family transcriptional regulator DNA-binding domain-containing protein [Echinicola marina]UCS93994.1 DNA-binding response regulator [Echinicola marina]